ncbi:MAG: hypothetical protein WA277_01035 [Nitrospirota bacterium]
MKYFSKKSFTMRQVVGLLTVVFLGISVFTYAAVSFTDFTTNTTISSSEMNTKLNALKDAVNKVTVFKHVSTAGNISADCTYIDNLAANGDPNAILTVTHEFSVRHNKVLGVYYSGPQWCIYNEDTSAMPVGLTFNVMVIKP